MKVKIFIAVFLTCLYLTACSTEIHNSNNIDLSQINETYSSVFSPSEDILAVLGDKLLLHNYDTLKNEYLLFDINEGKTTEYNDENRCMVSSASFVNVNDSYYISEVVVDNSDNSEKLRIIELNRDGDIRIIRKINMTEEVSPFIYFAKYDHDSFLLIHRIGLKTYIDMFNCKERKFSRFLTLESTEKKETYLEKVSVNNEKVYVTVFEEGKYYLKIYNKDRCLIATLQLDIPLLRESAILQFYVVNDLLLFENWNSEQALYKLQNNTLNEIPLGEKRIVSTGLSNIYKEGTRYIFLTDGNGVLSEETPNNNLYALDLETCEIKYKEIVIGKELPCIYSSFYCENGSLVLSIKDDISSQKTVSYILDDDFLCRVYK